MSSRDQHGADPPLNVARLRILRELAAAGTIAATAEALWLTPSAVSQQLASLERETDAKLIERSGRSVRLTDAGRLLAERSEGVLVALREARAAVSSLSSTPAGRVRMAAFPSVVCSLLPAVVGGLRKRFPELTVEVEDLEAEQSLAAIRRGQLDLAIVDDAGWESGAQSATLTATEIRSDRLVCVFAGRHRFASLTAVPWRQLAPERLITEQRSSSFARTVEVECRRAGFEPQVGARFHDASAILAFVADGEMVAVLPELALSRFAGEVEWRPLVPIVERRLIAITRPAEAELPGVRAVLAELAAA